MSYFGDDVNEGRAAALLLCNAMLSGSHVQVHSHTFSPYVFYASHPMALYHFNQVPYRIFRGALLHKSGPKSFLVMELTFMSAKHVVHFWWQSLNFPQER